MGEEKANMEGRRVKPAIRVGPAGWSYADWDGVVYPAHKPRGFHEAEYLSQFFDTIEINTSFYQPLRPEMSRAWMRRVEANPRFKFTAKLFKAFTHERNAGREEERTFKQGLAPLVEAGRLGALLLQFPWSFRNTKENHEYASGLFVQFMEYPLVLEVRHASWNQPEIFQWLAEAGVGFCNIDQPVIGRSVGPSERATAPVGYIRLHGRNYENWFTARERAAERYDYLYTLEELAPWVERIKKVAGETEVTYVITNNHFEGKGVTNALELIHLLRSEPVRVPETLTSRYPELEKIAAPEPAASLPAQAALRFEASPPQSKNACEHIEAHRRK